MIGQFEGAIEKIVALAVLMPIVASMGGNAGTQTVTVAVRALAMGELTAANALALRRQGSRGRRPQRHRSSPCSWARPWSPGIGDWRLGAVIGAAMVCNLFAAALAGTLIPLGLQKFGVDPAVSSTVFLTTVTDVIGFLAFLGLATRLSALAGTQPPRSDARVDERAESPRSGRIAASQRKSGALAGCGGAA